MSLPRMVVSDRHSQMRTRREPLSLRHVDHGRFVESLQIDAIDDIVNSLSSCTRIQ